MRQPGSKGTLPPGVLGGQFRTPPVYTQRMNAPYEGTRVLRLGLLYSSTFSLLQSFSLPDLELEKMPPLTRWLALYLHRCRCLGCYRVPIHPPQASSVRNQNMQAMLLASRTSQLSHRVCCKTLIVPPCHSRCVAGSQLWPTLLPDIKMNIGLHNAGRARVQPALQSSDLGSGATAGSRIIICWKRQAVCRPTVTPV